MPKYRFKQGDVAFFQGKPVRIKKCHKSLFLPLNYDFRIAIENYYTIRYLPSEEFGMAHVPEEDLAPNPNYEG
jgi:hypothetical protein